MRDFEACFGVAVIGASFVTTAITISAADEASHAVGNAAPSAPATVSPGRAQEVGSCFIARRVDALSTTPDIGRSFGLAVDGVSARCRKASLGCVDDD